jgi:hypothetical protein
LRWGRCPDVKKLLVDGVHDQDRLSRPGASACLLPVRRRCVHLYPALPVRLLANPPTGSRHPASGCALRRRGYGHDKYRKQVREAGIKPVIARRGEQLDSGLDVYRWAVEQGFAYCTGSAGSAPDEKSATTSTKPSSASPAPSPAGDASTTSQTVRSSSNRPRVVRQPYLCAPSAGLTLG